MCGVGPPPYSSHFKELKCIWGKNKLDRHNTLHKFQRKIFHRGITFNLVNVKKLKLVTHSLCAGQT